MEISLLTTEINIELADMPVTFVSINHMARTMHISHKMNDIQQALKSGGIIQRRPVLKLGHTLLDHGDTTSFRVTVSIQRRIHLKSVRNSPLHLTVLRLSEFHHHLSLVIIQPRRIR